MMGGWVYGGGRGSGGGSGGEGAMGKVTLDSRHSASLTNLTRD